MSKKSRIDNAPARRKNRQLKKKKWLIYCNGITERLYIEELIAYLKVNKNVIDIHVKSTSRNTLRLVNEVSKFYGTIYPHNSEYDMIFCVYDKDSFNDFEASIRRGESYKYEIIWSNECFELWFILHTKLLSSNVGRRQYFDELTYLFREKKIFSKDQNYERHGKTLENIFDIITHKINGNFENALKHAKNLYHPEVSPEKMCPATKMHILVEYLKTQSLPE